MTRRPSPQLVALARTTMEGGAAREEVLAALRTAGASQVDCLLVLREVEGLDLHQAKLAVDTSETWADLREATERLRDLGEIALRAPLDKDPGRKSKASLATLTRAIEGDLQAFREVADLSAWELHALVGSRSLVVRPEPVAEILRGVVDGRIAPDVAQSWASFVRWGYVPPAESGAPTLEIEYDAAAEVAIADAVGWLDELGDDSDPRADAAVTTELLSRLKINQ